MNWLKEDEYKNEGFSDFCEGWVPFLLEIKQKAGWLVGM